MQLMQPGVQVVLEGSMPPLPAEAILVVVVILVVFQAA